MNDGSMNNSNSITYLDKIVLQKYKKRLNSFYSDSLSRTTCSSYVSSIETDQPSTRRNEKEENILVLNSASSSSSMYTATRTDSGKSTPIMINDKMVDKKYVNKTKGINFDLNKGKMQRIREPTRLYLGNKPVSNGTNLPPSTNTITGSRSRSGEDRKKNDDNLVHNTPTSAELHKRMSDVINGTKIDFKSRSAISKMGHDRMLSLQQTFDEWEILDKELHDEHHYFTHNNRSDSFGSCNFSLPSSKQHSPSINRRYQFASRQGSLKSPERNTPMSVNKHSDARQSDEWARLDQEIHDDKHEFIPHEEKNEEESNEPLMTLDSIIAAAKRKSISLSPCPPVRTIKDKLKNRQVSLKDDVFTDDSLSEDEES